MKSPPLDQLASNHLAMTMWKATFSIGFQKVVVSVVLVNSLLLALTKQVTMLKAPYSKEL